MTSKRILFWLPENVMSQLKARGTISESAREALDRYFAMIDHERQKLDDKFTAGELSLMADYSNGSMYTTQAGLPLGLLANAEDTEDVIYDKWGVDRKTLLDKLRSLSVCQEAALVDAIERFWAAVTHMPGVDPGDLLK